jgi:uncharacterized protein (TIGR02996 family)
MSTLACAAHLHAIGHGAQVPFLQACWDDPLNDVPRLVYADWLDENGFPLRARFIRAECALARVQAEVDFSETPDWAERLRWECEARLLRWINQQSWEITLADVSFDRGLPISGDIHNRIIDWHEYTQRWPLWQISLHIHDAFNYPNWVEILGSLAQQIRILQVKTPTSRAAALLRMFNEPWPVLRALSVTTFPPILEALPAVLTGKSYLAQVQRLAFSSRVDDNDEFELDLSAEDELADSVEDELPEDVDLTDGNHAIFDTNPQLDFTVLWPTLANGALRELVS